METVHPFDGGGWSESGVRCYCYSFWIVYMDVFTGSYNVVPTLHTLRVTELSDPWTVYINVFTGIYGI